MSTASWRASVVQSIDVAAANSLRHIVLTTGGRSERFAEAALSRPARDGLRADGHLHRRLASSGRRCAVCDKVTLCGMIGKLAKLATGQMQTHVAGGGVDLAFLADLAREAGATEPLVSADRRPPTRRGTSRSSSRPPASTTLYRPDRRAGRASTCARTSAGARGRGHPLRLRRADSRSGRRTAPRRTGPLMSAPVVIIGLGAEGLTGLGTCALDELASARPSSRAAGVSS